MLGAVALLWPDSARTKNPIAKIAATQKINRAALDVFILLVLFYAPAFRISLCRIAADALRFSISAIAQPPAKKASRGPHVFPPSVVLKMTPPCHRRSHLPR